MSPPNNSNPGRRSVLVVENHQFFRKNLVAWIATQPELDCCAEAGNVPEAQQAVNQHQPELIVLDLTLNGASGLDFLRWLGERTRTILVIVLSQYEESLYADRALEAGARAYVSKAAATDELEPAIGAVLRGFCYVSGRGAFECRS